MYFFFSILSLCFGHFFLYESHLHLVLYVDRARCKWDYCIATVMLSRKCDMEEDDDFPCGM